MKRSVSVVLIIAAVCVGLGIAMLIGASTAAAASGLNLRRELLNTRYYGYMPTSRDWYGSPQTRTEIYMDTEITDIEISGVNNEIKLVRGGSSYIVEVEERYQDEYTITQNNGRLRVKYEDDSQRRGWFNFDLGWLSDFDNGNFNQTLRITVTVPEDVTLESLEMMLVNGAINGDCDAEQIRLEGVNMSVDLKVPEEALDDTCVTLTAVNGSLRVGEQRLAGGVMGDASIGSGSRSIDINIVNGTAEIQPA